jgi:replicative DNA helicase
MKRRKTPVERWLDSLEEMNLPEDIKNDMNNLLLVGEGLTQFNVKDHAPHVGARLAKTIEKIQTTPAGTIAMGECLDEMTEHMRDLEEVLSQKGTTSFKPLPSIVDSLTKAKDEGSSRTPGELVGINLSCNKRGFPMMSKMIDGLQPGINVIIGASHVGKTCAAVSILNILVDQYLTDESSSDHNILYIAMDDNDVYAAQRFVANHANVGFNDVKKFKGHPKEKDIINAYNVVKDLDSSCKCKFVDAKHVKEINDIESYIESMLHINDKLIVFIDGVYNIATGKLGNKGGGREDNIARFDVLKKYADNYNIPIIITGEVKKERQRADRKEPLYKEDIMETGKLVYHAAVILSLYPEDYSTFEKHKYLFKIGAANAPTHTPLCIRIAKDKRGGGAGEFKVELNLTTGEISEVYEWR